MRVKLKYGSGNELTKDFPENTTLGCILGNAMVRGALGYGSNVAGHIGGVPQDDSLVPHEGAEVSIHDKSCSKALDI